MSLYGYVGALANSQSGDEQTRRPYDPDGVLPPDQYGERNCKIKMHLDAQRPEMIVQTVDHMLSKVIDEKSGRPKGRLRIKSHNRKNDESIGIGQWHDARQS